MLRICMCVTGALLLSAFGASPALAQLNTAHLKGTVRTQGGVTASAALVRGPPGRLRIQH